MMAITVPKLKRFVRTVELEDATGATGYTRIKFCCKPIARMVDNHDIGPEEHWAAKDIDLAWQAISGALTYKSPYSEKIDRGYVEYTPASVIDAVTRYKAFARHWSKLRAWGDRTFEIVIAVVIDERPLDNIEVELNLYRGKAKMVVIAGLRDYAARSRMVPPQIAQQWMTAAAKQFHVKHPSLRMAILQAKNI